MQMTITNKQALSLLKARGMTPSARKAEKKAIFAAIHREHGIPTTTKLVFFLDNPDNPLYRVIRDKRTKLPLDDGKAAPVAIATPKPKAAPAKTVKKAAPVKTVKKAAPAKTVKKAAPAKTVKKAAPAKTVKKAAPAKAKAPIKAVAAKAVKKAGK